MLLDNETMLRGKRTNGTNTSLHFTRGIVGLFIIGTGIIMLLTNCQEKISNNSAVDTPKEVATGENPAVSPSGKYLLVIVSGYDGEAHFQSFQILSRDQIVSHDQILIRIGETLYSSPDRFATRFTTYFLWGQQDRVWVYSGDIGTFFWARNTDTGEWEKYIYIESNVSAPEFLKEVRPNYHQK